MSGGFGASGGLVLAKPYKVSCSYIEMTISHIQREVTHQNHQTHHNMAIETWALWPKNPRRRRRICRDRMLPPLEAIPHQ
jgi:hypothetical protein